jgi:hypothetical protein
VLSASVSIGALRKVAVRCLSERTTALLFMIVERRNLFQVIGNKENDLGKTKPSAELDQVA